MSTFSLSVLGELLSSPGPAVHGSGAGRENKDVNLHLADLRHEEKLSQFNRFLQGAIIPTGAAKGIALSYLNFRSLMMKSALGWVHTHPIKLPANKPSNSC